MNIRIKDFTQFVAKAFSHGIVVSDFENPEKSFFFLSVKMKIKSLNVM